MPPSRKRTNLNSVSLKARSVRLARQAESQIERDTRLESNRERSALSLESESSEQRERRLSLKRKYTARNRELESDDTREQRLSVMREHATNMRELESESEREERLTADRERHSLSLRNEDEIQHAERLAASRDRYSLLIQERENDLYVNQQQVTMFRASLSENGQNDRLESRRQVRDLNRELELSMEDEHNVSPVEILNWVEKNKSGFSYNPNINYSKESEIGDMNVVCRYCKALKWKNESSGLCCSSGKVHLEPIQPPPEPLKSLLNGDHPSSKQFLHSVRSYNSAFQMTSFGGNEISEGPFMPTFKIQGQVYHRIGSLLPVENAVAKFLQIYFISDYEAQTDTRMAHINNIDRNLVRDLQTMLNECNPFVKDFKTALHSLPAGNQNNYKLVINADRRPATAHRGRYNEPTTNEVAVLLVNEQCDKRDIVIRTNDDRLIRICETHRSYDALQYPLLLCHGEDGYNFMVFNVDPVTREENSRKKTSALQFYCYRIMVRQNQYNHLHYYRKLFNQYLVDMYAKIETERLIFIRMNQKKLRSEEYIHLQDALRQDGDGENLGRLVILPSSFTGGPRYMHERTQDAFCYVRKYSRPDLFITVTTNPKWDEIQKELLPGQVPYDRHDLISRVFHLKLKILIDLLTKKQIFGAARCFMYSVEWQKRGLPHAHVLLWLEEKIRPNEIDRVIRAELPNPEADPRLYNIVKTHMVHGPCGTLNTQSPCMKEGRCSKRFPKQFTAETMTGEDGYPSYQRRNAEGGGFTALIRMRGQTIEVDNRWIVPYSPILSRTFETHINVELCSSVQSIKYICKYVNKGSDQATFGVQNEHDEVLRYQSGRYVSTSEAVWRVLSFPIHERFPPVIHLAVHLENGQRVYFDPNNVRSRVEDPKNTTLMAFFKLCRDDEFAKTLLYEDVPSFYTFDKQRGIFNRRKRGSAVEGVTGVFRENTLGRVYTIHPNNSECYFLRLLLHHVRGPTSFDHLKSVEGVVHPTYQAACRALHLLEDDTNWDDTLREACVSDNAAKLRQLFAVMLVFCNLSNPAHLWDKYRKNFCEDIVRDLRRRTPDANVEDHQPDIDNRGLLHLQDFVISIGGNPLSQYGIPSPHATNNTAINKEYAAEMSYNVAEMSNFVQENEPKLNGEQKGIFSRVVNSVKSKCGEIFFIDAPGGTGKTFLINLLLAKIRKDGDIALAVASSGIAATLLPGGKTAHSMFKIPIDLDHTENPVCGISKNSEKAKLLRDCALIVWDECTMANKKAVEAVERTLKDIRNNNRIMGGVTFLFSGDFRQTLPVITRGTRADEVNACLKRSLLWSHVKKLSLTTNMRAQLGGDSLAREFSDLLLKIGNGTMTEVDSEIQLPLSLCKTVPSVNELIAQVYPEIENLSSKENSWLCERAILTPKNGEAAAINNTILSLFEAPEMVFQSINRVVNDDDATNYPIEFLNSLNAPGLPAHSITLKVGAPIMLLRNLSAPKLCNGTRLLVKSLQRNVIEASILTGCGRGEVVFIPRIPLIPNNYPFEFKRVQFPVSVCFAMTINKSQGQTLRTAGVDLRTSCFSHGQLYVACSRVSSSNDLYICAPQKTTHNVVYKEALL